MKIPKPKSCKKCGATPALNETALTRKYRWIMECPKKDNPTVALASTRRKVILMWNDNN